MNRAIGLVETGVIPDAVIRRGIRRLIRMRHQEITAGDCEAQGRRLMDLLDELRGSPIAVDTDKANEQHYELPPAFFDLALGAQRKYSSCYYPAGVNTLDAAEAAMLELSAERADLQDGQDVLELGCGWGSLTLWMARRFPSSRIVAVSNSSPQREFIEAQCRAEGVTNVTVITADMNDFGTDRRFDRVVSVEMFEHMRNYEVLMQRVATWLRPGGKLFVHIFVHREHPYKFEARDASDWMSRYFFTGGIMPSHDLLLHFQRHLQIERHWKVSGVHYQRTAEAWLQNVDRRRAEVLPILAATYGDRNARRWMVRWRTFFMAVAELFGFRGGDEWWVGHYRFDRPAESQA